MRTVSHDINDFDFRVIDETAVGCGLSRLIKT